MGGHGAQDNLLPLKYNAVELLNDLWVFRPHRGWKQLQPDQGWLTDQTKRKKGESKSVQWPIGRYHPSLWTSWSASDGNATGDPAAKTAGRRPRDVRSTATCF